MPARLLPCLTAAPPLTSPHPAAYYYLYVDSSAQPFNGSADYTITFPSTPPATSEAFWSLQALDLDE